MRKLALCKCENKDADQLCGNRAADLCLCFPYIDKKYSTFYTGKIDNYKQFKFLLKYALWHSFLVHFSFCLKVREF